MKLDEEVITLLGFGDYWGDSGESGTRYLTDPADPNRSLMRIHDVDEFKAGVYAGGYHQKKTEPQHYTTDDWRTIETVEDLLEEACSGHWKPEAHKLLLENAKKHNLLSP